MPQLTEHNQLM